MVPLPPLQLRVLAPPLHLPLSLPLPLLLPLPVPLSWVRLCRVIAGAFLWGETTHATNACLHEEYLHRSP